MNADASTEPLLTDPLERRPKVAFLLAALSGFLMFSAFPPLGWDGIAYIALVPFLWALRLHPGAAKRLGYAAGLVMWIPSMWFLQPVTVPGLLCLAAYCALYWIPVGWLWGRFLRTWHPQFPLRAIRLVLGGAAWWCLAEQVRGWILTGFPWNQLGVSQWQNYGLIQLASLGGVTLISFVLVTMNLGIGISFLSLMESVGRRVPRRMHPELYLPILLMAVSFTWGIREMRRIEDRPARPLRIQVIQPNLGMHVKWDAERVYENYRILWETSDRMLGLNPDRMIWDAAQSGYQMSLPTNARKPDLLIWPETSLPETYDAPQAAILLQDLGRHNVPVLVGTLDAQTRSVEGQIERRYWNASMLHLPDGTSGGRYAKTHLVMFGEYIPFGNVLPFLRSLTPFPEDITPGEGPGVLSLPADGTRLGMLICFEDLMPYLSRQRVADGADLFVNQTNDAWFDPLWGSRAHLAHAVFRSVEQRRPTVRAANSGVSAWVDPRGMVREQLETPEQEVRLRGGISFSVEVAENPEKTPYHRFPAAFPLTCLAMSLLLWDGSFPGKPGFFHRRRVQE
jgi:apolipoprotein N-acyltransferase